MKLEEFISKIEEEIKTFWKEIKGERGDPFFPLVLK